MTGKQKIAKIMEKAVLKSFGKPDEVRKFPKGRLELVKVGGVTIGRGIFEPGWKLVAVGSAHRQDEELRGAALPVSRFGRAGGPHGRRHRAQVSSRRHFAAPVGPRCLGGGKRAGGGRGFSGDARLRKIDEPANSGRESIKRA